MVDSSTAEQLAAEIDARLVAATSDTAAEIDATPRLREMEPTAATAPVQQSVDARRDARPSRE